MHPGPVPAASSASQDWAMDFVHDQLADGRKFRVLTVLDKWRRECVVLEVGFGLTGDSVVKALERLAIARTLPRAITVDNGAEFTSKALDKGCHLRSVQLDFIRRQTHGERPDRVVQRAASR